MQSWLGPDLQVQRQGEGDLGDRLSQAFQTAFAEGKEAAIVLGTDCPELDAALLEQAFQELQLHDLVLGPASDGGYYLLGLRQPVPELFANIPWSTSTVLSQTLAIAEQLGLSIALLPTLSDVDYPEDLEVWYRVACLPKISVIIPVLNEVDRLASTLATVQTAANVEILVVDGGSQDGTVALAESLGVRVVPALPSRAAQMNLGANLARGEVLLFLHGDTQLPAEFDRLIQQALAQPETIAGAFELEIAGLGWSLRWVEWGVKWRSRLLQLPYGDQALFLKTTTFRAIGGFADLPIMEDFEIVQRLRRLGKVAIVPASVLTSGRRWHTIGVLKTTLINQFVILSYYLGVSPKRLAAWYRSRSSRSG